VSSARTALGDDAIVGLGCGLCRATAQRARDVAVDYVSFGLPDALPPVDLVGWWATLTDTPALVRGPVDNDNAGVFVQAGASFLECGDYILAHPKGILQGTVNMLYAIELALEKVKLN